jgi:hypothetical protein
MIYNLILSITNLTCILPILTCLKNKDYLTLSSLILVSLASIISHGLANYRNNLPGLIKINKSTSILLNEIDKYLCLPIFIRICYIFIIKKKQNNLLNFIKPLILLLFNSISTYITSEKQIYLYLFLHCIWHIFIFIEINKVII